MITLHYPDYFQGKNSTGGFFTPVLRGTRGIKDWMLEADKLSREHPKKLISTAS